MSQLSHSLDSSLLVRDVAGDYRPANADEVLQAAQRVLAGQMRGCEALTSPQVVRDFLRVKLGTLEHEVFGVIHLDAQNRVIDYVEMFRGTVSQTSVYPREVVKEALARNSAALLLVHNHPSGAAEPVVPMLGEPLPGDLGPAIVHAQSHGNTGAYTPAQPGRIAQPGDAEDAARSSVFFRSSSATKAAPATTAAAIQPEQASGNQAFNPMATTSTQPTDPTAIQNRQDQKQAFVANGGDTATRNPASLQLPTSPYQVMAGTIIPAALVTGINSDLPGQVIANVTEAVYDTATGRFLLIPQGSRLIGRYDSQVSFGQRRVLLVWTRLILPDTSSISLDRLPGIDPSGYAGLEDGVDWHWDRILAGAALSTLLGVGAELAAPNNSGSTGGVTVAVRQSAQDTVNQVGQEITKRNVSIQPTLTIRPGFPMRVMVNKDLILRPYQPLFFQRGSSQ